MLRALADADVDKECDDRRYVNGPAMLFAVTGDIKLSAVRKEREEKSKERFHYSQYILWAYLTHVGGGKIIPTIVAGPH